MKAKLLILAVMLIGISACKKDQFTTKPQLKFKSVSPLVLNPNQLIEFQLEYTDKEGDIQNKLYIQKITSNCPASDFSTSYAIPSNVPKTPNSKGELDIRYAYGINLGYPSIAEPACPSQNDTCVFRFALTDKANNTSDTITSPQIVLIKR